MMTYCSRNSRLKRGTIGAVIGAAIGEGLWIAAWSRYRRGFWDEGHQLIFDTTVGAATLPFVGAVFGTYLAALKPQCA